MNIKHKKWDQDWQSQIKSYANELDPVKNKQVGALLEKGDALQTEKNQLEKEIKQLKNEQKVLANVYRYHRHAKKDYERLTDATNKATHNPRQKNFLGIGTGTKWNTDGWLKKTTDHFTPASGKLDNLYKVKISGTDYETTEEQIINTIARVVKALEKVDSVDFTVEYNKKESDTTKQAKVKDYLQELKDQAPEIIIGSDKDSEGNAKQPTYDFANTYQKFDKSTNTWTTYAAPAFNYQHFFEFIELVHNQPFLNDLHAEFHKDVDQNENWQILLKGEKWEAEKLKSYGVEIDESKTELYKTSETDKITAPAGTGIAGWLDLAHSITQDSNNQSKLSAAFNSSPTQQLLTDISGWTDNKVSEEEFEKIKKVVQKGA